VKKALVLHLNACSWLTDPNIALARGFIGNMMQVPGLHRFKRGETIIGGEGS
jgi:hypothetical protein